MDKTQDNDYIIRLWGQTPKGENSPLISGYAILENGATREETVVYRLSYWRAKSGKPGNFSGSIRIKEGKPPFDKWISLGRCVLYTPKKKANYDFGGFLTFTVKEGEEYKVTAEYFCSLMDVRHLKKEEKDPDLEGVITVKEEYTPSNSLQTVEGNGKAVESVITTAFVPPKSPFVGKAYTKDDDIPF